MDETIARRTSHTLPLTPDGVDAALMTRLAGTLVPEAAGGGNQAGDAYRYAVITPRTFGASVSQKW